ncbi:O-succinylbenzoic acid--CoA ligase [hydrothermal vent metagenome]|uniref:O-succinylbenzoic acid--CoA ligase n=1 Tax=hydrothermal vent metagenome TaxID=652676 RepID=A0A3B1DE28_9ZZZZ
MFKAVFDQCPTQIAIIDQEQSLSYAQLNAYVNSAVNHFQNMGIQKNDTISILSENTTSYLITLCALWRMGAVVCLLNVRLPDKIIEAQTKYIQSKYLLKSKNIDYKNYTLHENNPCNTFSINQIATILFTSGSTGIPKAAVHTFANHCFSAKNSNINIPIKRGDRWLLSLPLYHVGGLSIFFRILLGQGTVVIPKNKNDIGSLIVLHKITHISLVPTQLQKLLQENINITSLKMVLLGSGPISENLLNEARKKSWPIYKTYGMTEMSSQIATAHKKFAEAKIFSGNKVKISKKGEVLIKGNTLFKGYLQKNNKIDRSIDSEGWFATGDLGSITKDGFLNISGRKDNMFISGGENIQPEEIEKYLCQIDGIQNAIVIAAADKKFGFRPKAFVQLEKKSKLKTKDIIYHLSTHLPKFKCPDKFFLWPKKMTNKSIKIKRSDFKNLHDIVLLS